MAFTFGTREHKYLDKLTNLLKPFNIKTIFANNNFAYKEKISEKILVTGKKNTQVIERHHLTLRTRIKRLNRKTNCFFKSLDIHKSVISFFINRFLFAYFSSSPTFL